NIVQARCPHCQNTLRIPADWLEKPMRCKHCKKTFQAKARRPEPAAPSSPAAPGNNGWPVSPPAAGMAPPTPVAPVPVAPAPIPPTPAAWAAPPSPPAYQPAAQYPYPPAGAPTAPAQYPGYAPMGMPGAQFGFDEVDDQEEALVSKPRVARSSGKGLWIGAV